MIEDTSETNLRFKLLSNRATHPFFLDTTIMLAPNFLIIGTLFIERKTCLMALVRGVCRTMSNWGIRYSVIKGSKQCFLSKDTSSASEYIRALSSLLRRKLGANEKNGIPIPSRLSICFWQT